MSRKAMQVALEALESDPISHAGLVTAVSPDGGTGFINGVWHEPEPPKKEWVGLTGDEVYECWKTGDVVAAVEAKLKEKNKW